MKTLFPAINGIALVITIVINYLSNSGILNGNTMKTISDKYFNYFTPAGYAFSIWGLIYLGLLGFVVYTGRSIFTKQGSDPILSRIGWWFTLSCVANSLWVMAWLYEYTGASFLIMAFLLFCLLKIVVNTRMGLDYHPFKSYVFIFWPFALYSGWISVALIANAAAWLTKINWSGWGLSASVWTIIIICAATLVNIFMIQTRNLRGFGFVGIWALMAISVSNSGYQGTSSIIYTCYGCVAILLVTIVINGLKYRQRSIDHV
ncbi:MAG: hypothetical protein ACO1NS_03240 [Daejeonella sp.]|uniref:hypothetical protein n=1 Tax=Daejeonella sp. JGW-45 TaxID=3034148 RepID=UPI0023EC8314|nr:hypothetical protein [Daejeonella sp. JGW-45]